MSPILVEELALWQAQGFDFQLLDVRRVGARACLRHTQAQPSKTG
jgi:hypothetical protein